MTPKEVVVLMHRHGWTEALITHEMGVDSLKDAYGFTHAEVTTGVLQDLVGGLTGYGQFCVGHSAKFTGNGVESLPVAAGTFGNLRRINDTGSGSVQYTLDESPPSDTAGPDRGEVTGPYQNGPRLKNIDLSKVRLKASSTSADYTVDYEVCQ